MSLIRLDNGTKYAIESTTGIQQGMLRQRERNILRVTFAENESKFAEIKAAMADPANTDGIIIYMNENDPKISDEHLLPPVGADGQKLPGPAQEAYRGYTILGQVTEEDRIVEPGTAKSPPVYARRLTVELGERQYGE